MQLETSLLGDGWDVLAVEYPDLELFTDAVTFIFKNCFKYSQVYFSPLS